MKRLTVHASHDYDILIGDDLLSSAGRYVTEALGKTCTLCVVSDDRVAPLYLEQVVSSLKATGHQVCTFVIPNGESSKSTASLVELLEFLAEQPLTRADALVALGGGVVGDLTGFCAAVYLRGIPFVQIPTTLLAAVDSSVGGKTAVDLKAGKNLAGAFHQPSLVLCDYTTLDTLTPEIFADGCAEVIKYGVINDRPFFDLLKEGIRENIEEIISLCVQNKAQVVEGDEFDRGSRQLLNLGHTIGHAIELCSHMEISHGSAVAMGMVIVTRAAVNMGLCPREDLDELISLLCAAHLPVSCPFGADELARAASADKKRSGEMITLIVPYGIGKSRLQKIPVQDLAEWIRKGLEA